MNDLQHVVYEFRGFRLDATERTLHDASGNPILLTPRVFDTLLYLVEHAGELVYRDTIMQAVWPNVIVADNNLNQNISTLRQVLGEKPGGPQFILTVPGSGYRFIAPRERALGSPAPSTAPQHAQTVATPSTPPELPARRRASWLPVALAGIAIAGVIAYIVLRDQDAVKPEVAVLIPRITPVTAFPGLEWQPSLSPDGTRVAFARALQAGDNTDIYVMQIDGHTTLRITDNLADDSYPAWSPDGGQIVFLRYTTAKNADIILISPLGGPERKVHAIRYGADVAWDIYPHLAWMPDAKRIVFTSLVEDLAQEARHALQILSLDTGEVQSLSVASGGRDFSPAVSRDSKWLAFSRHTAGPRNGRLVVQRLDEDLLPEGASIEAASNAPWNRPLIWSPDGKRILFFNGASILEWDLVGEPRIVYTPITVVDQLSVVWRADGLRAVAMKSNFQNDIWAVPLDPVTHVAAGPPHRHAPSTMADEHPRYSPDGLSLAFVSNRSGSSEIWLAGADGQNPQQLSNLGAFISGFPRWSTDGRRIAFMSRVPNKARIYIVDVAAGAPKPVTDGFAPSWSRDGRFLYVNEVLPGNPAMRVIRVNVADSSREYLFDGEFPVVTADGQRILYGKPDEFGIFARSLEGDPARNPEARLIADSSDSKSTFPVDSGIYYVGCSFPVGQPCLYRYFDYAQQTTTDVAPAPRAYGLGLTVAPDQSAMLYTALDETTAGADLVMFDFSIGEQE